MGLGGGQSSVLEKNFLIRTTSIPRSSTAIGNGSEKHWAGRSLQILTARVISWSTSSVSILIKIGQLSKQDGSLMEPYVDLWLISRFQQICVIFKRFLKTHENCTHDLFKIQSRHFFSTFIPDRNVRSIFAQGSSRFFQDSLAAYSRLSQDLFSTYPRLMHD